MLLSIVCVNVCALPDLLVVRTPTARAPASERLARRHDVRVLRRHRKRSAGAAKDRLLLAAPSRCRPRGAWWRFAVRPETLLRWHRAVVRRKWATVGRRRGPGRPPLRPEVRALIPRLAHENPRWGYRRSRGELRKLGHSVAAATIQTLLRRRHVPPAPRRAGLAWPAFPRVHAAGLPACACFAVETVRLQTLSVLFFLHVHTRRVFVAGCTAHPTGAWVTPRARTVCWGCADAGGRPTVLLRDRDATFVPAFDAVLAAQGVRVVRTPVRAPGANAFAARRVGTARRACRDGLRIAGERYLGRVLRESTAHYNAARPHRALRLQPPLGPPSQRAGTDGAACRRERLGGLVHEYERAAA
jgi:hypothetical protein